MVLDLVVLYRIHVIIFLFYLCMYLFIFYFETNQLNITRIWK